MEFLSEQQSLRTLKQCGVSTAPRGEELQELQLDDAEELVRIHLAGEGSPCDPHQDAKVVNLPREQLAPLVESIIHRLNLKQILLIPIARWRNVFDCVAFTLADNEDWQEIDATASVELNRRDPLLCEAGDLHTLAALVSALLENAEEPSQALFMTTTAIPLVIEVVPQGAIRITIGSAVLADEVLETVGVPQA